MKHRIIYVGVHDGTCRQRAESLRSLGHETEHVTADFPSNPLLRQLYRIGNRLNRPPDWVGANRNVLRAAERTPADLLWVDKGLTIRPRTLTRMNQLFPRTVTVSYSPDDMLNPDNQSVAYLGCIPLYHLHVTTKSYNVAELKALGARDVLLVDNAFEPEMHRPLDLDEQERRKFQADVGFVGGYEEERAEMMLRLAQNGVKVHIWGPSWERFKKSHANLVIGDGSLHGLDYARAINATKINLGFLRRVNRDLQTTRSIEIPACEAFMLAERTDEHESLFDEGKEVEYFVSFDELLQKCAYYLEHEEERLRIAAAGRRRCLESGYRNADRLAVVLSYIDERWFGAGSASNACPFYKPRPR